MGENYVPEKLGRDAGGPLRNDAPRYCPICNTKLSVYNSANYCFTHESTGTGLARAELAGRKKAAEYKKGLDYREQIRSLPIPEGVHGTLHGYLNFACKCRRCTDANRDHKKTVDASRRTS